MTPSLDASQAHRCRRYGKLFWLTEEWGARVAGPSSFPLAAINYMYDIELGVFRRVREVTGVDDQFGLFRQSMCSNWNT